MPVLRDSHTLARAAMICALILFGLLVAPIGFLAGFVGGLPDRFAVPFVEQWPLLKILLASNPGAAIHILLQQPLMVVAHGGPDGGAPVWRLFFYPVPLAVLLAVSVFVSAVFCNRARGATHRRLVSLLPGMVVLAFVTTYVQVATCCTGGPRWALDIWLFSLAYDPLNTLMDWQQLYQRIEGALSIVQIVLALLGTALLASNVGRNS